MILMLSAEIGNKKEVIMSDIDVIKEQVGYNKPATEAQIRICNLKLKQNNLPEIPTDFENLIKQCNGFSNEDARIFGADVKDNNWYKDVATFNIAYFNGNSANWLILGENDFYFFIYDSEQKKYCITDRDTLEDEYPDRKIYIVDSLAASSGFGLLLDTMAEKRDAGASMEELVQFTDPDTGREETENTVLQPALDEINADLAESCTGFAAKEQEARGLKKDMGENYVVYTNEDTLQVVRADDKVFSVVRDDYTNTGGAHGYSAETAYSYDAASGKRLTLADMLKNTDIRNLTGILKTEVVKQAAEGQADGLFTEGLEDTIAGMLKATDGMTGDVQSTSSDMTYGPLTWYAGQDGLHFVFNAYDIGAYAAGRFLVTLTPEAYPDLVNDAWFGEETASIEPIDQFTEYQVDGKKLYISVDWSSDTQTIKSLGVQYGDANKTFDCYSYGNEYYLADTGNGKVLLVNTTQDNDLETLEVIPLTQGDLKMTSGDFGMYSNIPIDPDNLILAGRTTVMSTMTAERPYRLAADGTLDPLDKWYLIQMEEPLTFTLKQDAELPVLKAMDSDETQNVTFPKGTKMTPLRTDNEKTLDCRTSDGRIIRFTVDTAEFPQIVNGTYKLEDLLDGTVFAG